VNPNEGLLRDFLDGKFDSAGHPLNAKILEAEALCPGLANGQAITLRSACQGAIPDGAQSGELIANVRLRVTAHPSRGSIMTAKLVDAAGGQLASETLTVSRLRGRASWIDLPISLSGGSAAQIQLTPSAGSTVEIDYIEVFPKKFGLVVEPGSGVASDTDQITFELPKSRKLEKLELDGVNLLPKLDELLAQGKATKTSTEFRTLISVAAGDLAPARAEVAELRVRAGSDAARIQLRKTAAPCLFEGDPAGTKILVTGFQPFPADGWHDNVSAVGVTAMDPAQLRGAQVMRLVLPVEYDRAAAAIEDVIGRCAPETVISFGQGGGSIALEQTAYNLQDTGEIAGGVPDNRGLIRAATPIDPDAEAERATLLPLDAIEDALVAIGESPQPSTDPGRYICNNVMFQNIGIMTARGGRGGFIHLPYTTSFDDAVRARYGNVVLAAVQATADVN
jgi:pyroglutamyl-peptidase